MGTRRRGSWTLVVVLLCAGCTTTTPPERRAAPSPTPTPQARVTDEPDGLGIVDQPSRAVLRDRAGDVWRLLPRPVAREAAPIDVRRAVVEHTATDVRVRIVLADLRPVGRQRFDVGLTTPAGRGYAVVASDPGERAGRLVGLVDAAGAETDCPGLRFELDYAADTVGVQVPRTCLGDPEWVQVRLLVSLRTRGQAYAENAHNARAFSEFGTRRLFPT